MEQTTCDKLTRFLTKHFRASSTKWITRKNTQGLYFYTDRLEACEMNELVAVLGTTDISLTPAGGNEYQGAEIMVEAYDINLNFFGDML